MPSSTANQGPALKCEDEATTILERLQGISPEALRQSPEARKQALKLSQSLSRSLIDPFEVFREMSASFLYASMIRIAQDLQIFSSLTTRASPCTTSVLALPANASEPFVQRILRLLGSISFISEVGPDLWQANAVTEAMAVPANAAGYRFEWDALAKSAQCAPEYFRSRGYRCPPGQGDGLFHFANGSAGTVFDFLANNPNASNDFNIWMGHTVGREKHWVEWFPIETRLLQELRDDRVVLVDVAGGKGHDIQAFRRALPGVKGRLVLQDLCQALSTANELAVDPSIERQEYNFFNPNPIQGARIYLLHHILHDWSDEACLEILGRLREAADEGYSRLLICELVLPESGASVRQASFDIFMMAFNSGLERTRGQWEGLLKSAGFEVLGVWYGPEGNQSDAIIEATPNKGWVSR